MQEQIIVSGIGGQGALFLTRVIAQAAVDRGIEVLTSETHGMAQRGGTVLSTIKIGPFASPLVRSHRADVGLLLWQANLEVHRSLVKPGGVLLINGAAEGEGLRIDASSIARSLGSAVLANNVLLGFAVRHEALFCTEKDCVAAIKRLAPERFVEANLVSFYRGLQGERV